MEEQRGSEVPMDVSSPSAWLELALWFPAFFVMVWFMHRIFGGRWITEPPPTYGTEWLEHPEATSEKKDDDPAL
jgi:hypothetical protein